MTLLDLIYGLMLGIGCGMITNGLDLDWEFGTGLFLIIWGVINFMKD